MITWLDLSRAVGLTLTACAFVACTGQEQVLGGSPAPNDPPPAPTTWLDDLAASACPWRKPAEGSECATHDGKGYFVYMLPAEALVCVPSAGAWVGGESQSCCQAAATFEALRSERRSGRNGRRP